MNTGMFLSPTGSESAATHERLDLEASCIKTLGFILTWIFGYLFGPLLDFSFGSFHEKKLQQKAGQE